MSQPLVICAMGTPQPQGSTKAFVVGKRAHITTDNTRLKPWRETLVHAAWEAMARSDWQTLTGPVEVHLSFRMPRGKSVRRQWPTVRPDIDKLTRAVLDSLSTAQVYRDDAQVIALAVAKCYAAEDHPPGVIVTVREQP